MNQVAFVCLLLGLVGWVRGCLVAWIVIICFSCVCVLRCVCLRLRVVFFVCCCCLMFVDCCLYQRCRYFQGGLGGIPSPV